MVFTFYTQDGQQINSAECGGTDRDPDIQSVVDLAQYEADQWKQPVTARAAHVEITVSPKEESATV